VSRRNRQRRFVPHDAAARNSLQPVEGEIRHDWEPTFTMDQQVAQARREMGEDVWRRAAMRSGPMAEVYRGYQLADALKDQIALYDRGSFLGHFASAEDARRFVDEASAGLSDGAKP
jgi:hypothetical protein